MIQVVYEHVRTILSRLGRTEWAAFSDHGERVQQLVANVPPAVWRKVSGAVAAHYRGLEERYGRATAIAILAAAIVGSAVPAPGTTFLAMAPLIALAELHHQLTTGPGLSGAVDVVKVRLADSEILQLGRQWVQDLADVLKQD
jgi:hypothetical protein